MFDFKQFSVDDSHCGMKVCTDSVLLGGWTSVAGSRRVLDLGCGSGLLALMMAQRIPGATITAIDIDEASAADAARNVEASPWSERIDVCVGDALTTDFAGQYDLIVCNPPYFANGLKAPGKSRARARNVDDAGGLSAVTSIGVAARVLTADGSISMVTPADQEDAVVFASEINHLQVWRLCRVRTQPWVAPARILWQIARKAPVYEVTEMAIYDANHNYTPEYRALTNDFYLNM